MFSQYKKGTFSLNYEESISEDHQTYLLENLICNVNSDYIKQLLINGDAELVCIVECPSTMIRRKYVLPLTPVDIKIPLSDLNGKVEISAFVIAKKDIYYSSSDFLEDYEGYSFTIEQHDIIAADDGYVNTIDFDDNDDNKKSSIFSGRNFEANARPFKKSPIDGTLKTFK